MADAKIPDADEIAKLPRWARVAFAARCARRVLPLFAEGWPAAPAEHLAAVQRAVVAAEQIAHTAADAADALDATRAADAAASSAMAAAATAATWAARAAAAATAATRAADAARAAWVAADTAARAYAAAARGTDTDAWAAIRDDFDLLLALASAEAWTDDTPVPPGVFGPLWPGGPPPGWPDQFGGANSFELEIEVPDHVSDEDAVAWAKKLAGLLSDLDVAGGGRGLAVVPPVEVTADADAGVPVGGPTP